MEKHKVFISYHHDNDQWAKEKLLTINKRFGLFIDMSVGTGDIDEDLPSQEIREEIRDNYLKDTSVLILLVGSETKNRKHIDWEIYSSMYNGKVNKQSGILVITLPESGMNRTHAGHGSEE
ncbi:TIR domain-containing protein [Escherichia coli]